MLPRCLQKAAVNDFGPRLHHSLTPLDYGGLDLTYKLSNHTVNCRVNVVLEAFMRNGHLLSWVFAITMPMGMLASRGEPQSQDLETFEVASVKPGTPGFTGRAWLPGMEMEQHRSRHAPAVDTGGSATLLRYEYDTLHLDHTGIRHPIQLFYCERRRSLIQVDLNGFADRFDVQGVIPAGSPSYTLPQLQSGSAPALQAMLRNLLTERLHPMTKQQCGIRIDRTSSRRSQTSAIPAGRSKGDGAGH